MSPSYPKDENGVLLEGEVHLFLKIASDGKPTKIEISRSSGDSRIDDVAISNAKRSTFPEDASKDIEKRFSFKVEE